MNTTANANHIDCNTTANFLHEYTKMCNRYCGKCEQCPMHQLAIEKKVRNCHSAFTSYPSETLSTVQKWSDEHKEKTVMEDFLEKYPNAPLKAQGIPETCPKCLGYEEKCKCQYQCVRCWNRPLEELQK